MKEKWSQ